MPCLKVLLAPGKQCVVVLGQGPGSQQLSLLPCWAMRCTGSWVQAGGQGHSAGRNFSNCLGSSCCQGSLGTHWETRGSGNGLQVWLISLCTSGVLPVWGGFSIPAMAAPFAFIHVVSYVRVFSCVTTTGRCGFAALSSCPSVTSPWVGGAMQSPGLAAWAGHIFHPGGPVWLCLLCCTGRQLDFPAVCCCCGFHFIVLRRFFL